MKITIDIPDTSTSLGLFLNFRSEEIESTITTTNWLVAPNDGDVLIMNNDGKCEQIGARQ